MTDSEDSESDSSSCDEDEDSFVGSKKGKGNKRKAEESDSDSGPAQKKAKTEKKTSSSSSSSSKQDDDEEEDINDFIDSDPSSSDSDDDDAGASSSKPAKSEKKKKKATFVLLAAQALSAAFAVKATGKMAKEESDAAQTMASIAKLYQYVLEEKGTLSAADLKMAMSTEGIIRNMRPPNGMNKTYLSRGLWPPRFGFPAFESKELETERRSNRVFWLMLLSLAEIEKQRAERAAKGSSIDAKASLADYLAGKLKPRVIRRDGQGDPKEISLPGRLLGLAQLGQVPPVTPYQLLLLFCNLPSIGQAYYMTKTQALTASAPRLETAIVSKFTENLGVVATRLGGVVTAGTPLFEVLRMRLIYRQGLPSPAEAKFADTVAAEFMGPALEQFRATTLAPFAATTRGGNHTLYNAFVDTLRGVTTLATSRLARLVAADDRQEAKVPESQWPIYTLLQIGRAEKVADDGETREAVAKLVGKFLGLSGKRSTKATAQLGLEYVGDVGSVSDLLDDMNKQLKPKSADELVVLRPADLLRLPDASHPTPIIGRDDYSAAVFLPCVDSNADVFAARLGEFRTFRQKAEEALKLAPLAGRRVCVPADVIAAAVSGLGFFAAYFKGTRRLDSSDPKIELQVHLRGTDGVTRAAFLRSPELAAQCQLAQFLSVTAVREPLSKIIDRVVDEKDRCAAMLAQALGIELPVSAHAAARHAWRQHSFILDHRVATLISAYSQLAQFAIRIPAGLVSNDSVEFVAKKVTAAVENAPTVTMTATDLDSLFIITQMLMGVQNSKSITDPVAEFRAFCDQHVRGDFARVVAKLVSSAKSVTSGMLRQEVKKSMKKRIQELRDEELQLVGGVDDETDTDIIVRTLTAGRALHLALSSPDETLRRSFFAAEYHDADRIGAFKDARAHELAPTSALTPGKGVSVSREGFACGRLLHAIVTHLDAAAEQNRAADNYTDVMANSADVVRAFDTCGTAASKYFSELLGMAARQSQLQDSPSEWLGTQVVPVTLCDDWASRFTCWLPCDQMVFGDVAARFAAVRAFYRATMEGWPRNEVAVWSVEADLFEDVPYRTVMPLYTDGKKRYWDTRFELPARFDLFADEATAAMTSVLNLAAEDAYPINRELVSDVKYRSALAQNQDRDKSAAMEFKDAPKVQRALQIGQEIAALESKLHPDDGDIATRTQIKTLTRERRALTRSFKDKGEVAKFDNAEKAALKRNDEAFRQRLADTRLLTLVGDLQPDLKTPRFTHSIRMRAALHAYCARQLFMALMSLGARRQANYVKTLARFSKAELADNASEWTPVFVEGGVFKQGVRILDPPAAATKRTFYRVRGDIKASDFDDPNDYDTIVLHRVVASLRAVTELKPFDQAGADSKFLALVADHMAPFKAGDAELFTKTHLRQPRAQYGRLETHIRRVFDRILALQADMRTEWDRGINADAEDVPAPDDKLFIAVLHAINNFTHDAREQYTDGQGFRGLLWRLTQDNQITATARISLAQSAIYDGVTLLGQMIGAPGSLTRLWNVQSARQLLDDGLPKTQTTETNKQAAIVIYQLLLSEAVLDRYCDPPAGKIVRITEDARIQADQTDGGDDDASSDEDSSDDDGDTSAAREKKQTIDEAWKGYISVDGTRQPPPKGLSKSDKPLWYHEKTRMKFLTAPMLREDESYRFTLSDDFDVLKWLRPEEAAIESKETKRPGDKKGRQDEFLKVYFGFATPQNGWTADAQLRLRRALQFEEQPISMIAVQLANELRGVFQLRSRVRTKQQESSALTKDIAQMFKAQEHLLGPVLKLEKNKPDKNFGLFMKAVLDLLTEIERGSRVQSVQSDTQTVYMAKIRNAVVDAFGGPRHGERDFALIQSEVERRLKQQRGVRAALEDLEATIAELQVEAAAGVDNDEELQKAQGEQDELVKAETARQTQFLQEMFGRFMKANPTGRVVDKQTAFKEVLDTLQTVAELLAQARPKAGVALPSDVFDAAMDACANTLRSAIALRATMLIDDDEFEQELESPIVDALETIGFKNATTALAMLAQAVTSKPELDQRLTEGDYNRLFTAHAKGKIVPMATDSTPGLGPAGSGFGPGSAGAAGEPREKDSEGDTVMKTQGKFRKQQLSLDTDSDDDA